MQIAKGKTAASLIALFLTLTIAVSIVAVMPTVAQTVESWRSFIYVATSPPVIGVGQQVLLFTWTADMPPDIGESTGDVISPTGRAGWYDMSLTVTKPDNTTETIDLPYTDSIGGTFYAYTPTAVGTYYLQANFVGQWKNTTTTHRFYESATSEKVAFTVQEELIKPWAESPLPSGYWTRPVSGASREWYVLLGDYLGGAANVWPPGSYGGNTQRFIYSTGPESAHILWSKPLWAGGIMDAYHDNIGYATSHYQGLSFSPIILGGKIYMDYRDTGHTNQGYLCVDLYSGQTLYYANATKPSFGQIYKYDSGNQHGGFPYLWRTSGVSLPEIVQIPNAVLDVAGQLPRRVTAVQTFNLTETSVSMGTLWEMLDGYTGNHVCYIANVTSGGRAVYGKDGSILRYNIVDLQPGSGVNYYLQVWNSSHGTMPSSQTGTGAWQWRPMGGTFGGSNAYLGGLAYNYVHDGQDFFSLNVSIPLTQHTTINAVREGEYMIGGSTGSNDENGVTQGVMWKISLETGQEGKLLWNKTFTPPSSANRETVSLVGVYPEYNVFIFEGRRVLKRYGYDMETMQQIWETEPEGQMNYYSMQENVYQGMLLSTGWSGEVIAYNITTGEKEWVYTAENIGFESPYGNYPINIFGIADGKIYTLTGEHSITQPMWRGPNMRCINASNGEEIWKLLNFGANGGASLGGMYVWMAEGKVVGINFLDNMLYCVGKGSSAITVVATPEVSVHGSNVVIKGTVTDDTPSGRRNTNDLLDFTLKGTPAISDEDMGRWMEYLFMQQEYPADAKGVEVVLTVVDPNSNCYEIGRTTSDVLGTYGYVFEPLVPGTYELFATFEGSKAYGGSTAKTYINVMEAPAATAEPTPTPASVADLYFVPAVSGIIVAIIAVGLLVVFLLLRKR